MKLTLNADGMITAKTETIDGATERRDRPSGIDDHELERKIRIPKSQGWNLPPGCELKRVGTG